MWQWQLLNIDHFSHTPGQRANWPSNIYTALASIQIPPLTWHPLGVSRKAKPPASSRTRQAGTRTLLANMHSMPSLSKSSRPLRRLQPWTVSALCYMCIAHFLMFLQWTVSTAMTTKHWPLVTSEYFRTSSVPLPSQLHQGSSLFPIKRVATAPLHLHRLCLTPTPEVQRLLSSLQSTAHLGTAEPGHLGEWSCSIVMTRMSRSPMMVLLVSRCREHVSLQSFGMPGLLICGFTMGR